ncbi:MAG: UDP-glucose 4-epimerase GalE [Thermomonas sp.]|uniref:UDP-glucose 4-epimerase GalE n=1 Tax=Thermomonas sp. TaxID=1971895 RepID=UPI001ECF7813|nr:UDP-glucose 4-epimerase GalE [Thermomonas sp.]MBV2209028.1 UDP-glucose 4-epimerase GalE [Thermomonas sp.]
MRVLVTGGAGYVGAHASVALQQAGHEVVVLDNLSRGCRATLDGIAAISGQQPLFVQGDLRDGALLRRLLREQAIEAVLHFAALKDVSESCQQPLHYYDNNVGGTLSLLQAMMSEGVTRIVFSSSAAVYGHATAVPTPESAPFLATHPYGHSKQVCEQMLLDAAVTGGLQAAVLRYFNPVGAHPSAMIGDMAAASNLLPQIARVAAGLQPYLQVHGQDYPTPDGTGVRDYVHVLDIADAHVQALLQLVRCAGSFTLNLGRGAGLSVLQLVTAFERASGRAVPLRFVPRRAGDVAISCADPANAEVLLGWRAMLGPQRMCEDAWRWQQHRPVRVVN